ncbi:hypothetical protein L227DRAFT_578388 [Lentinus tigrinus ALCF2SS1-6]|uniref:Uncharacterized protein n=1 Tax=Lentinus tigrinus ALCF2SS1-6 TaxID=1328759 RepID=A0A5C2S291_9APHY|nr:hypothetical protein L227DRAFT_578388 [Lentinus tigrinus ALCF2SS1-6]
MVWQTSLGPDTCSMFYCPSFIGILGVGVFMAPYSLTYNRYAAGFAFCNLVPLSFVAGRGWTRAVARSEAGRCS